MFSIAFAPSRAKEWSGNLEVICTWSQDGAGGEWRDVEAVRDSGTPGNCPLKAVASSQVVA